VLNQVQVLSQCPFLPMFYVKSLDIFVDDPKQSREFEPLGN